MKRRHGFTLVEMLVSMALIVFIMVILSEAFVAGLESFRQLKATGDMDEKLRSATTLLRRDLRADHFGNLSAPLSKQTIPVSKGFFRVYQGSQSTSEGSDGDTVASTRAVDHMLAFTINLGLNKDPTVRTDRRENFMTAFLAGTTSMAGPNALLSQTGYATQPNHYYTPFAFQDNSSYYTQWAEVAWFLRATGQNANGTTLYALYRRQLQAVTDNGPLNNPPPPHNPPPPANEPDYRIPGAQVGSFGDMSCELSKDANGNNASPSFLYFNSPDDLTAPCLRFGMAPLPAAGAGPLNYNQPNSAGLLPTRDPNTGVPTYPILGDGSDIVMTDVISFDVKLSFANDTFSGTSGDFIDLWGASYPANNPAFTGSAGPVYGANPVTSAPTPNPRVFDTWSAAPQNPGYCDYSTSGSPNLYTSVPAPGLTVRAVQITIRVWDRKTTKTRQVTVIQDL